MNRHHALRCLPSAILWLRTLVRIIWEKILDGAYMMITRVWDAWHSRSTANGRGGEAEGARLVDIVGITIVIMCRTSYVYNPFNSMLR